MKKQGAEVPRLQFFDTAKVGLYAEIFCFCPAFGRKCSFCSFGKDEVPSSNLGSSSRETRCPARDSGFCFCLEGKLPGRKPIQKPIPIDFKVLIHITTDQLFSKHL